jgi:enoyl-CoA hydratase/carnithine racemase
VVATRSIPPAPSVPQLNIVTMAGREELRAVFEALDADSRIRVVVPRAVGEHFPSRPQWR